MKEAIAKIEAILQEMKMGKGSFKMDDDKSEQSYNDPIDEGNENKKKMFVAMMKKKLEE